MANVNSETLRRPAQETRAKAEQGRGWYAGAARTGLVAKGISYGLVGVLAIGLAIGHGGKATSRNGALAALADKAWGKIVLVLLALGFAAYALWRFVQAFAQRDSGDATGTAKKWGKRAGYIGRGAIYASLTYTTLHLLAHASQQQSQNEKAHKTTARLFDLPAGRWLVLVGGIVLVGAGLWNLYRGLATKFEDKWRGGMSHAERVWGRRAGVVGHAARSVVFGLIGIFVIRAAINYDPKEAIGLDGALQKLAHAAYGPYLLGVTAVGLVAYGVFCLVDARYRDVSANS